MAQARPFQEPRVFSSGSFCPNEQKAMANASRIVLAVMIDCFSTTLTLRNPNTSPREGSPRFVLGPPVYTLHRVRLLNWMFVPAAAMNSR